MAMMETIGKGFSEPTERVKRLKKEIVEAMPVIETERARLVTESFKETEGLSPIMRRAKVIEKLLNNMQVTIRDDELIVGTAAEHPRSSEIGIEFSIDWLEPEYDTLATRDNDPFIITDEAKAEMLELAKYWKGKTLSEYAMSLMTPECQACQDHAVFNVDNYKLAGVGHYVPFWEKVIDKGYSGIIDEVNEAIENLDHTDPDSIAKKQFYDAMIITYSAAINFGHRYAAKAAEMAAVEMNPQRKAELQQISKNLQRVPEYGATTFWEAIQAYWLTNVIIHVESNGHSVSPGPFDRQMIKYYRNDPTITPEFAQELIDCLMIKYSDCNKVRDSISAAAFAGYTLFELLTIGGTDEEGNDLTNELSYMVLEAHAHTRMPSPSIGVRVGNQTPDEFLYRVCETIRLGTGMPNVFNDEIIIPALENRGVPLKIARTYSPSGCVEPDLYHREFVVDETADLVKAAKDIVNGCSFDNNLPCIAEKEVVAVNCIADELIKNMCENGAYLVESKKLIADMWRMTSNGKGGPNKDFVGKDALYIAKKVGIPVPPDTKVLLLEADKDHPFVRTEMMMPILPVVRAADVDEAIALAKIFENGNRHTSMMHSKNIEKLSKMGKIMETTIFVKNGPSYAGIGVGGEGSTTFTIAGPTGEGITSARAFARKRRCVMTDAMNIR